MNILAINGSHDKCGDVQFLLQTFLDECKKLGMEAEIVNAYEAVSDAKIPFCIKCSTPCSKQCYKGTKLETLFDKMKKADAIVLGSPVYFGSMSGQLKCLFDKTRALRTDLTGKLGAAVVCGASRFGGQEATITDIHNVMYVEGMTVVGAASKAIGAGHLGVSAQSPSKEDEFALGRCVSLAHRLYEELNK